MAPLVSHEPSGQDAELLELGDAFFEMDRDWRIVRVNRRQEELSRLPRDQTVGRTFAEVWPELATPESRDWREYDRCMRERVPVQFQAFYAPLDLWTGVTAYPVRSGGIAVFFRDITAAKRAEREQARLASIVEDTDDAIISKDLGGVIQTWNQAAERLFGYAADEVIGRPIALLLPADRSEEEDRILAELRAGRRVHHFETRRVRKDGTVVDVSVTVSPLRDASGELVGASKIARDVTGRNEVASALRASEAKFRSVFEQAALGMGRVRFGDARWIDVNDAFCRMLGRSRGEMLSTPWPEITHPDDVDLDLAPFRRMAAGELESYTVEKRFLHADGRHVWAKLTLSLVRDALGRPDYEIAIIEDIGDRKRAEEALAAALQRAEDERRRLAAVLESLPAGVVITDAVGGFTHVNAEFKRIWGAPPTPRSAEDYGGWRGWWPDGGRPVEASEWALARALTTGAVIVPGDVVDVEKFDGSGRATVLNAAAPIRNAAGEVVGAVLAEVDITEQKRAEAALRGAREHLRSVVEHLPAGLIVADLSTRDLQWNRAALAIHGYSGDEEQHRFLESLVAEHQLRSLEGDAIPVERWPLPRLLRGESFLDYELRVHNTRLGWDRVFSYSGVVLDADAGAPVGLMTIRDVTDRSRAEESLRTLNQRLVESDRRKDEFLGMLSHELRNPLAPIRNALYILEHAEPNGLQARRAREVASRQVAHLTRLVDDLLDVTRVARGKIELRRARLDLVTLARATAEDHRPLMHDRGLELEVAAPDEALVVDGDETRLAQVLGNLLSNAAKFTPAGGRVALTLEHGDRLALMRIRDTGVGISPDLLPTVFDPFIQAKQTLARSEGGLGLGLALVKGLVELHGGQVSVTSGGPGSGTEFVVELPLVAAIAAAAPPQPVARARRPHRVLVVDDNEDAAQSLADVVRMFGHDVEVAHDGPSALATVVAHHPDVVLCDLGLPGMDGYEVARAVRARLAREVRLVAVSGYAQPEDVKRSVAAGFDAHVAKPPDPARIERLLTQADGTA